MMKKLLIIGSSGFLGKYVESYAKKFPYDIQTIGKSKLFDLSNFNICHNFFDYYLPDIVINCAGYNGGIKFNDLYPADVFHINTQMALNIFKCCKEFNVEKIVSMMTSCAYPDMDEELREKDLWSGPPHETIACHGLAKRNLDALARMYNKQYGLNAINLIFNTLYGPGDTLDSKKAKVMTSLIVKFHQARRDKLPKVEIWGSGEPKREFVYVKDAAHLIFKAIDKYNDSSMPLNISSGQECSIRILANKIADIVGYDGEIVYDTSKPDGQMRKFLNTDRMREVFGDVQFTSLEKGIRETVEWLDLRDKVDETIEIFGLERKNCD